MTFQNVTGTGALQWFAFHYRVNDPAAGEAYIYVNDEPAVNVSSLNHRAGYYPVVPVQLKLSPGEVNTITVGSVGTEGKRERSPAWMLSMTRYLYNHHVFVC